MRKNGQETLLRGAERVFHPKTTTKKTKQLNLMPSNASNVRKATNKFSNKIFSVKKDNAKSRIERFVGYHQNKTKLFCESAYGLSRWLFKLSGQLFNCLNHR